MKITINPLIGFVSIAIITLQLGSTLSAQTLNVPGGTVGNIGGGNVGVGTSTPTAKLHVVKDGAVASDYGLSQLFVGGTDGNKRLALAFDTTNNIGLIQSYVQGGPVRNLILQSAGGNVGIGTTSPIDKLQITSAGDVRVVLLPGGGSNNRESLVDFWATFDNCPTDVAPRRAARIQVGFDGHVWGTEYMLFGVADAGDGGSPPVERMRITAAGNVGIGTANPTQKLSVNGAIRAKEVIVDTGWADYVFAEGYRLPALSEVEAHIKKHQHLPGIPSATEVAKHGISLGDMQAKLLAKIEELTLHQIAQDKRLTAQSSRVEQLHRDNTSLQNR